MIDKILEENKGKKILILANGISTMNEDGGYLDYSQSVFDSIWTVNGGWTNHPTSNLGFMMDDWASVAHDTDILSREHKSIERKACPIPIMTPTEYPEYPAFVRYPLEKVLEKFPLQYFGETTSYMVALALYCEPELLVLDGTDYMGCKASERACTEAWVGYGLGKGYDIRWNPKSHFMCTHTDARNLHVPNFYGYLKETFPYEIIDNGNGTTTINYEKTRHGEINEFKKDYQGHIERNEAAIAEVV